jgi:hypothetical protein
MVSYFKFPDENVEFILISPAHAKFSGHVSDLKQIQV